MTKTQPYFYFWTLVLGLLVFLNYMSPGVNARDYKNFIFLVSGLFSLVCFGSRPCNRGHLLVFGTLFILSVFNQHHMWAKSVVVTICYIFVGFAVLNQMVHHFRYDSTMNKLQTVLGLAGVGQCLWVMAQGIGLNPYSIFTVVRPDLLPANLPIIGSMGHWMVSGSFLAIVLPYMIRVNKLLILFYFGAMVFLPSGMPAAGLLSVAAFYTLFTYYKEKWFWIIILISLLFVGLYIYKYPFGIFYPSERIRIWSYTLSKFTTNFLIGDGPAYFNDYFAITFKGQFAENHRHPHNEFLMVYTSFGIIGLALMTYYYLRNLLSFKIDKYAALSLAGALAPLMFGFPLHTAGTAVPIIISLASIIRKRDNFIRLRRFL